MTKPNKVSKQDSNRRLKAGIEKHFAKAKSLTLNGQELKPAEVAKLLQASIDASQAADAAKLVWLATVRKATEVEATTAPILRALRAFVRAAIGETSATLADFGIQPRKAPKKLTTEEKVLAVEKTRATRAARHTMGKHQREKIVGDVAHLHAHATGAAGPIGNGASGAPPSA